MHAWQPSPRNNPVVVVLHLHWFIAFVDEVMPSGVFVGCFKSLSSCGPDIWIAQLAGLGMMPTVGLQNCILRTLARVVAISLFEA